MNEIVGVILVVCLGGGLLAGSIAYSRMGNSTQAFVAYFIIGMLFPLVGIICAAVVRPPAAAPQPPGWYPDPWGQAPHRWYDGYQWTFHLAPPVRR